MAIYELRVYTTCPGRMPALLARFKDHTLRIWERHGIEPVGFWYVQTLLFVAPVSHRRHYTVLATAPPRPTSDPI